MIQSRQRVVEKLYFYQIKHLLPIVWVIKVVKLIFKQMIKSRVRVVEKLYFYQIKHLLPICRVIKVVKLIFQQIINSRAKFLETFYQIKHLFLIVKDYLASTRE